MAPPIGAARARLFDLRTSSRRRRRAHRPRGSAQTPRIHPSERPRTATLMSAHRVLLFDLAGLGTFSFSVGLLSSISVSRTNEPNGTTQTERDAVFSSAYGRRYWGEKTCIFKPYPDCTTVLQYDCTTVQIRQYDDTTTVLQYWLLALGSWLLALGSWLLALGSWLLA